MSDPLSPPPVEAHCPDLVAGTGLCRECGHGWLYAWHTCSCGKPRMPNKPFCAECDLKVLIVAREMFPGAADEDFEREVPR